MSKECRTIHGLTNQLKRYGFPFSESLLPSNGIYILFQKEELGHNQDRIVQVGTHIETDELLSKLKQHFLIENKNRSIFRKNIGRALLKKEKDPFFTYWEIDFTTRQGKEPCFSEIDSDYQKQVEAKISQYIRDNFSFAVLEVDKKVKRLELQSKFISSISQCEECKPSDNWLGLYSPKAEIVESGLWLEDELYKISFETPSISELFESFP